VPVIKFLNVYQLTQKKFLFIEMRYELKHGINKSLQRLGFGLDNKKIGVRFPQGTEICSSQRQRLFWGRTASPVR
jgi:hypothetical protein